MLTCQAREILRGVEHVIVDEIHAIAGTKRGAHLALSLERLERLGAARRRRAARSASACRPPSGRSSDRRVPRRRSGRTAQVDDRRRRRAQAARARGHRPGRGHGRLGEVLPPDEQPGGPALGGRGPQRSIWPSIHPRILELIRAHRSHDRLRQQPPPRRTARRSASTSSRARSSCAPTTARIAREQRLEIEEELKAGRLPALVATARSSSASTWAPSTSSSRSSRPRRVARAPADRAGRPPGRRAAAGLIFPKYRGDLARVRGRRRSGCTTGAIEETPLPRNPLDVLAQQIVAMTAMDAWMSTICTRRRGAAAPFERSAARPSKACSTCSSGGYPSDEFAELEPRVIWDRETGSVEGRRRRPRGRGHERRHHPRPRPVRRVPAASGTPGRGSASSTRRWSTRAGPARRYRPRRDHLADRARSRPTASSSRPRPASREDAVLARRPSGRPIELGRAIGAFIRELEDDLGAARAAGRGARTAPRRHDLDELAAGNLVAYLEDEREATGALPTTARRRRAVPRRARRLARVHPHAVRRPRARAVGAGARGAPRANELGFDVQPSGPTTASRCGSPRRRRSRRRGPALPRSRRRRGPLLGESPGRAVRVALPRERRPRAAAAAAAARQRTPLWAQRQRASRLMGVAALRPRSRSRSRRIARCFATSSTCRRSRDPGGFDRARSGRAGRHRDGVAVLALARVRLRRRVPLRRRCAARRAQGAGAHARSQPARELIGRRSCATSSIRMRSPTSS